MQDCLLSFKGKFFKRGVIPGCFAVFAERSLEAVRIG